MGYPQVPPITLNPDTARICMVTGAGAPNYPGSGSWQAGELPRKSQYIYITWVPASAGFSYKDTNGDTVAVSFSNDAILDPPIQAQEIWGLAGPSEVGYYIM